MIFSRTWQEHLKHFEAADLKIQCSKCEFFKTKVHYIGFLVGVNGVQPPLEKVATVQETIPETLTNLDNF